MDIVIIANFMKKAMTFLLLHKFNFYCAPFTTTLQTLLEKTIHQSKLNTKFIQLTICYFLIFISIRRLNPAHVHFLIIDLSRQSPL